MVKNNKTEGKKGKSKKSKKSSGVPWMTRPNIENTSNPKCNVEVEIEEVYEHEGEANGKVLETTDWCIGQRKYDGQFVMPGNIVDEPMWDSSKSGKVVLGPGVTKTKVGIVTTLMGKLYKRSGAEVYWVNNTLRRYFPAAGDRVIGIIVQKLGEYYSVDIGGGHTAHLHYLAFEGATKKNHPDLEEGELVFGQLLIGNPESEPEMVCFDSLGKQGILGHLSGENSNLIECSIRTCRLLLEEGNKLLLTIGGIIAFEAVVGANGRVWIRAKQLRNVLRIMTIIQQIERMDDVQALQSSKRLVEFVAQAPL